ncbi:hypothetical protein NDU88_004266 [Pleurodeles waltl]|uniref:Uncharacterized protein n=1 Tax=Pleurodeles waltl TaxID=8319 RepID=A0AAV7PDH8_PLEWA|nr:hypothetical protein NDU88_004266 [Pleurodeles waltl]
MSWGTPPPCQGRIQSLRAQRRPCARAPASTPASARPPRRALHDPLRLCRGAARPVLSVVRGRLSSPQTEGASGPKQLLLPLTASRGTIPPQPGRPDTRAPGFHSPPGLARAARCSHPGATSGPGKHRRRLTPAPDKSRVQHTQ